ncbi:hypothetical protein BH10PLA2_BH10PLA2_01180 [soil metagenome]
MMRSGSQRPTAAPRPIRCAIYTRKSTEEGLEQDFNSLDAQREACAAYVLSQRHEGWELVPDWYEDGGYSGGNIERPGLKALLAEVAAAYMGRRSPRIRRRGSPSAFPRFSHATVQ